MGHRMRHIRTQAAIIRRGLDAGLDPKHMPVADSFFPKDQNKIDDSTRFNARELFCSIFFSFLFFQYFDWGTTTRKHQVSAEYEGIANPVPL